MKLIINADDFGLTHGVTQAIWDAMVNGAVTSTTMMVNTPGTLEAANIARENPELPIGLHINISLGDPLTKCNSLTRNGHFVKPHVLGTDEGYLEDELGREVEAQYERFVELVGRKPTHLDSHLYAHQKFSKVKSAVLRLAEKQDIPVRDMATMKYPTPVFEGNFKVKPGETGVDLKHKFIRLVDGLKKADCAELMVHPGWEDEWLLTNSSYNVQRKMEYDVLVDPDIISYLHNEDITLSSFRDLE